jgi:uncharacterized membrane protein (DUF4010 family)
MSFLIPHQILGLAVALGCGLIIGIEREQHKADHPGAMAAGIRTCALLALSGATSALIGPIAIGVAGAFVALATVASYWGTRATDRGLTTEVVMVLTFFLGVLAMQELALASGIAVVVTLLLQSKTWLHQFAQQTLTPNELNDALILLASALVVLPILPDTPIGALEGLNLKRLWLLVVLVMTINALGYVAIRALGARMGLPLTGLVGGFVSSAATVASMGHRSREHPALMRACAAAGTASSVSTIIMLGLIFLAVDRVLLSALSMAFLFAGLAILGYALLLARRSLYEKNGIDDLMPERPFHFGHALLFAVLIGGVLWVSAMLQHAFGDAGAPLAAMMAGFADTHAPAISVSELRTSGTLSMNVAAFSVLMAFTANTVTKAVVAVTSGGLAYAQRIIPGLALMLASAWAGWLLSS